MGDEANVQFTEERSASSSIPKHAVNSQELFKKNFNQNSFVSYKKPIQDEKNVINSGDNKKSKVIKRVNIAQNDKNTLSEKIFPEKPIQRKFDGDVSQKISPNYVSNDKHHNTSSNNGSLTLSGSMQGDRSHDRIKLIWTISRSGQ
jgi:hypothetical protein